MCTAESCRVASAAAEGLANVLPSTERADHPDTNGRLLDERRQVALLVLHPSCGTEIGAAEPP